VPDAILTATTAMVCPHGGIVQAVPTNSRLLIEGAAALTVNDAFVVTGCPNVDGSGDPAPCLTVQWPAPSSTMLINGIAALSQTSVSLCMAGNGSPQGPVTITATQDRVLG
jgi:hypothetical protein